jgi:hypothetical protein
MPVGHWGRVREFYDGDALVRIIPSLDKIENTIEGLVIVHMKGHQAKAKRIFEAVSEMWLGKSHDAWNEEGEKDQVIIVGNVPRPPRQEA